MLDVILQMVYRAESEHNGLVEVTAHAARPISAEVEAEWRVMRFNGITRQSVSRLVALEAGQARVAEPECLAQEYLKTMAAIYAALHADQQGSDSGMRLLCLGVGGGSLPMFLAHHFPRSHVDAVELDPMVIDAATQVMGLPAQQDNLCIHVQDAKNFVIESMQQEGEAVYDTIFMDVFDGDDNTPTSLLGEEFAAALGSILNPEHGALIMNVHGMSPALPAQTFRSALAVKGNKCPAFTIGCKKQPLNETLVCTMGWDPRLDGRDAAAALTTKAAAVAASAGFRFQAGTRACYNFATLL